MSSDIEYIEPTQEHVGQMVEVRQSLTCEWKERKLLAILPSELRYRYVCQDFHSTDAAGSWKQARVRRPLTYAERQAKCGLKVGDNVRILTLPESGQDGWKAEACGYMRHLVGCVYEITDNRKEYGFTVGGWNWPYFVLEKVEDRVATFNDIGKQVYVEGTPGDVFTFEIVYGIEGDVWRAVVRSGDKRFVYELNNLRVKK